jgi:hypothetical protein
MAQRHCLTDDQWGLVADLAEAQPKATGAANLSVIPSKKNEDRNLRDVSFDQASYRRRCISNQ